MAAATSFPSLAVPPQDDNMEMSSPQNRNLDDDIDIDFDDSNYDGGVQLQDDEQMLTDGEQTRPATATDDMMDDDVQGEGFHFEEQEAEMQDTQDLGEQPTAPEEDEELIDYGDDDYLIEDQEQSQIEDTAVEDVTDEIEYGDEQQSDPAVRDVEPELQAQQEQEQQAVQASQETVDEEIVRQPEEAGVAVQESDDVANAETLLEVAPDVAEEGVAVTHTDPAKEETATYPGNSTGTSEQTFLAYSEKEQTTAAQLENAETVEVPDEGANAQPSTELLQNEGEGVAEAPLALDTSATATSTTYNREENPDTPTDTGLHPMTLYYNGSSMPLFKSKKLQDGLLKDDNLANLSLAELMRNCRQRLALKLGIAIPEEQELTLAFDHLGLLLSENSRAAYQHSLSDVLEVYLQLHQNDGTVDSPALSMTLSHQQFTSQLAVLQQAAASGKGMSAFVQPQYEEYNEQHDEYDTHEHEEHEGEEYYQEEQAYYEDQAPIEEYTEDRHDEQPSELPNGEQNPQGAPDSFEEHEYAEEYQEDETVPAEEYEYNEEGQDGQNDDTQEAHYNDSAAYYQEATDNYEQPEHGVQPASYAEQQHVQLSAGYGVAHEAQEPAASISAGTEPSGVQIDESGRPSENAVEEVAGKASSPASSQTAQGDPADGEYDDWIDFDDDSDLTNGSTERADDTQDDAAEQLAANAPQQTVESDTANGEYDDWIDFDDDSDLTSGSLERTDDTQEIETGAAVANDQQQTVDSEDFLSGQDQAHINNDQHDNSAQQVQVGNHDEQQTQGEEEQDDISHDLTKRQEDDASFQHQPEDHDEAAQGDGQNQHGSGLANGDDHKHSKEHIQTAQEKRLSNIDDDIDFDEETTEQFEARKASEAGLNASTSGSPLGKRSREDDEDDEIDFDDDEPETKKARAG
ncbi:hypothetical protein D0862_07949 [Hortaea werneckii]|uniref:Uncharacterized protein n=1 Tax=Hortaea werneckii TaxID=91943 RepID=A0A3M7GA52_HORWE|nr:hypothetical protein D0862_07949 [Hortaea werneckii]